ncbi:MAG: hypothetical protein BWK76_13890 [Desulfobulbaceae bacterium A2]|nr:MAG: hypothetical protein BWK76_13890 [Desulfobulbaceae bacterium A2]
MMDFRQKRELVRGLLTYVVCEEERRRAHALYERYLDDAMAMELLFTHYSMPPGREDAGIDDLRLLGHRQGLFLIAALAGDEGHLYLLSSEGAEYLGTLGETDPDAELIAHFGPELPQRLRGDHCLLPAYQAPGKDSATCPACHCRSGELHELGCPVEVCPWCGGQLVRCACRFEQLGCDDIGDEELEELERLLEAQGRVPFSAEQRPGFLAPDLDAT